jgi:hypothetical protein
VVRHDFVRSARLLAAADAGSKDAAFGAPSHVDQAELLRRLNRNVAEAARAAEQVGQNVSPRAQAVFNHIAKTCVRACGFALTQGRAHGSSSRPSLPCKWVQKTVRVLDLVDIADPYTAAVLCVERTPANERTLANISASVRRCSPVHARPGMLLIEIATLTGSSRR